LGLPPSRCVTTSVVRLRPLTLLMPAMYRPSHFTRNVKFLYGSTRLRRTELIDDLPASRRHLPEAPCRLTRFVAHRKRGRPGRSSLWLDRRIGARRVAR